MNNSTLTVSQLSRNVELSTRESVDMDLAILIINIGLGVYHQERKRKVRGYGTNIETVTVPSTGYDLSTLSDISDVFGLLVRDSSNRILVEDREGGERGYYLLGNTLFLNNVEGQISISYKTKKPRVVNQSDILPINEDLEEAFMSVLESAIYKRDGESSKQDFARQMFSEIISDYLKRPKAIRL